MEFDVEKAGRSVQKQKLVRQAAAPFISDDRGGKSEHHRAKRPARKPDAGHSVPGSSSGGSAGNILQKRKVSQKTYIPVSSKEAIWKQVKRWCKRPPHRQ